MIDISQYCAVLTCKPASPLRRDFFYKSTYGRNETLKAKKQIFPGSVSSQPKADVRSISLVERKDIFLLFPSKSQAE